MTPVTFILTAFLVAALDMLARVQVYLGAGMTLHVGALMTIAGVALVAGSMWLAWRLVKSTGFFLFLRIDDPGPAARAAT